MTKPRISKKTRDALTKIMRGLRSGQYVHVKVGECDSNYQAVAAKNLKGKQGFSIGVWEEQAKCGTVGCIGGWLDVEMKKRRPEKTANVLGSSGLFVPAGFSTTPDVFTPKRCAAAIENFLKDGEPRWREVMRGTKVAELQGP